MYACVCVIIIIIESPTIYKQPLLKSETTVDILLNFIFRSENIILEDFKAVLWFVYCGIFYCCIKTFVLPYIYTVRKACVQTYKQDDRCKNSVDADHHHLHCKLL